MDTNSCGGDCSCAHQGALAPLEAAKAEPNLFEAEACCKTSCDCNSSDDGFGDYYGADSEKIMRERDRSRLEEQMQKAGYVEGITLGRDSALQEGFDVGVKYGCSSGMAFGHLMGAIEVAKSMASGGGQWRRLAHLRSLPDETLTSLSSALFDLGNAVERAEKEAKNDSTRSSAWKSAYFELLGEFEAVLSRAGIRVQSLAPGLSR